MDENDVIFGTNHGVGVLRDFEGKVQFNRKGKTLTGKEHNDLLTKYSKYNTGLRNTKTAEGTWNVVKAIDPSGVSNYPSAYKSLMSNAPIQEKIFNVASAMPVLGAVKTPTRLAKVGSTTQKTVSALERVNKVVDKAMPRIPVLDRKVGNLSQMVVDKINPKISRGINVTSKASTADKINLGINVSNITNKAGDVMDLKDASLDLYQGYQAQKKIQDAKNSKKKETPKLAMGGLIRPDSRKRHIAPLVLAGISAATSIIGGISASAKAKRAKEEARLATVKQEQDALRASYNQQSQADALALAEYDTEGNYGVQYYKKGGEISPKLAVNQSYDQMSMSKRNNVQGGGLKPDLPVSNGGYQTKGGNLVPIGNGIELAVGNRHNDTKVDGVSGIQLSQGGETVAEIEDKEVVADGNVVYSNRLKFKGAKSYADAMVAITKKRNKLEKKQEATNSKPQQNSIDRTLAGLNMAEETLFKTQELHKEMEGQAVLNNVFAYGGRAPGKPLPVPKWMQTFMSKQQGGKYNGYNTNALNDYQDPNNPNVIVSENGNPKYNYDPTEPNIKPMPNRFNPTMISPVKDLSAGMDDGSGAVLKGALNATNTVVGALGTNSDKGTPATPADSNVTTPSSVQNKSGTDWGKIAGYAAQFAPKIIDNLVNASLTRNAPELPQMLNAVAKPMETRVNVNPVLAEIRRRNSTINRSILNNTSNSNNAKTNMIATTLASGRQADEVLAGKENQEMALRNANAQNQQAVTNSNLAQANERSMMEFSRANDLNTQRSANASNLVGDITSTINEIKLSKQFDADTNANLLDDPMGSKSILYAQNSEFMGNKTNRDFIFRLARTKKNPVLVKYLKENYNYIE